MSGKSRKILEETDSISIQGVYTNGMNPVREGYSAIWAEDKSREKNDIYENKELNKVQRVF